MGHVQQLARHSLLHCVLYLCMCVLQENGEVEEDQEEEEEDEELVSDSDMEEGEMKHQANSSLVVWESVFVFKHKVGWQFFPCGHYSGQTFLLL